MENTNTPTSVKSDNELIAKFTGLFFPNPDRLKYDSSWDSLIPAVQKFVDLDFGDHFEVWRNHCAQITMALLSLDITAVYEKLVEGIKWHNTTTNENGE
jgi:hypothetical protein